MDLLSNPVFNLFLVLGVGFLFGKIKIGGVSIGLLGILLSSFIMGHFGILLPKVFETFGLVLYIYTIGIQAGPGITKAFDKSARSHIVLSVIFIGSATLITWLITTLFSVEKNLMLGIGTGSIIYTSGMAVAMDATGSSLPLIGYGISYPFGVIGMTLFAEFFPKIFKKGFTKAQKQAEIDTQQEEPEVLVKTFEVKNPQVGGKSLMKLKIREVTQGVISKVKHQEKIFSPSPNTILNIGDIIKVVGNQKSLDKVESLIGPESDENLELPEEYLTQTALITNSDVVNKTLQELSLSKTHNALVTKINRSGINLTPHPEFKLQIGDKVTVSTGKEDMKNVMILLGNNDKKLLEIDFFPITIGIILGILVGKINFSFLDLMTISPGMIGGILIVSILLGKIGRTGPIIWNMSAASCKFFEQLGILLFISTSGTDVGAELPNTLKTYGFMPFIYGATITLLPLIIIAFISSRVFKMNTLKTLESVIGITGCISGMAVVSDTTKREDTKKIFALTFPISLALVIIIVQIFSG